MKVKSFNIFIMKVKLFNTTFSVTELENLIAEWTNDLDPYIHEVKLDFLQLKDYFGADHELTPNGICHQWIEYTAIIIYSLKSETFDPYVDNPTSKVYEQSN